MADDHKIRVIVEGVDKLSGSFKGGRQDLENEIGKLQKKLLALKKDMKEATEIPLFGGQSGFRSSSTGQVSSYEKARKEVDALRKSLRELKAEALKTNAVVAQGSTGAPGGQNTGVGSASFFKNLSQGFKEATAAGDRLKAALSTAREDVKQRRKALDIETRSGQLRLNQVKAEGKARLDGIIAARRKELDAYQDVQKLRHKGAEIERRDRKNDAIDELEIQARKDRAAEKLAAKLQLDPLAPQKANLKRRKQTPEVAAEIAGITQLQDTIRQTRDKEVDKINDNLKKSISNVNKDYNREKINADLKFNQAILKQNREERTFVQAARARITSAATRLQNRFSAKALEDKASIESPDASGARKAEQDARKLANAAHEGETAFQRFGRVGGLALGDLRRGLREGRAGLVDFGSQVQKDETLLTRIGQTAGRAIGQFGNLVNLKWFLLTSALQVVGGLVVRLGAAFISIASSAVNAAAAIGSAFAAAGAQALPVVGLLAAAASRVQAVFKAVQLNQQNKVDSATGQAGFIAQRTAAEQLADAQYAVRQASLSVVEANYQLKQSAYDIVEAETRQREAELNLSEVRRSVSRGIVDSYINQQQAALSLRSAELSVIDAKRELITVEKEQKLNQADITAAKGAVQEAEQRLKVARAEGDQAEIANARAQLATAQQSLSVVAITARTTNTAVKEAQLNVSQSQLDARKAAIDKKRTDEDSRRTQKQGLKGSRDFIAAQRELKEATRAIAQSQHAQKTASQQVTAALHAEKIAQRELKDIEHDRKAGIIGTTPGKQQLKALLAQFSPSERDLFNQLVKLQAVYKKAFRPITDIIVAAISRAVNKAVGILKDPRIQAAARILATSISHGIDSFSTFLSSEKVRKDFLSFIDQAAKNLPRIVNLVLKLADAFLEIAKAGSPIFSGLLGSPVQSAKSSRIVGGVPKPGGPTESTPTKATGLLGIISRFDHFSNSPGLGKFLSLANKNLHAWESLGSAFSKLFFAIFKASSSSGLGLIKDFTEFLDHITKWVNEHPKKVEKFFNDSAKSLERIAKALVPLGKELFKLFNSKNAENFIIFVTQIVIPGLLLFADTVQKLTSIFLTLTQLPVVGPVVKWVAEFLIMEKTLNKVFPVTQKLTDLLKAGLGNALKSAGVKALEAGKFIKAFAATDGLVGALSAQFPKLAGAIGVVSKAMKVFLFTPPYWALIIAAIITAVILLDKKFHFIQPTIRALRAAFEYVFNWLKDNWKNIPHLLTVPFTKAFEYIKKVPGWITSVFQTVIGWFKKNWKLIVEIILGIFTFPASLIALGILKFKDDFLGIFRAIIQWFRDNWKTIVKVLIAVFVPGGLILLAIDKWHKNMIGFGKKIVDGIVSFFVKLPGRVINAIKDLPGLMLGVFKGLGSKIWDEIVESVPGLKWVLGKLGIIKGVGGAVVSGVKRFASIFGSAKQTPQQIAGAALDPSNSLQKVTLQSFSGAFAGAAKGNRNDQSFLRQISEKDRLKLRALLAQLPDSPFADGSTNPLISKKKKNQFLNHNYRGGVIHAALGFPGGPEGTDTVPAWLTPGEWVLNSQQQQTLSNMLGASQSVIKKFLFGDTPSVGPNRSAGIFSTAQGAINHASKFALTTTGGRLNSDYNAYSGPNYSLVPHADDSGNVVWFAQFGNGTYGQVSTLDANRILRSNGKFIPAYLRRIAASRGGLKAGTLKKSLSKFTSRVGGMRGISSRNAFSLGGVVPKSQRLSPGGPSVLKPAGNQTGTTVSQHFEVHTQSEQDWNYVMRLGAIHAQESF